MTKKRKRHFKSTYARARDIREIAEREYEPGNQRRSLYQVWRLFVHPRWGCCYHTFLAYLHLPPEPAEPPQDDPRQLKLF